MVEVIETEGGLVAINAEDINPADLAVVAVLEADLEAEIAVDIAEAVADTGDGDEASFVISDVDDTDEPQTR
jgi:hypothetical protein